MFYTVLGMKQKHCTMQKRKWKMLNRLILKSPYPTDYKHSGTVYKQVLNPLAHM